MTLNDWLQWIAALGAVAATLTGLSPVYLAWRSRREEDARRIQVRVRTLKPAVMELSIWYEPDQRHDVVVASVRSLTAGLRLAEYWNVMTNTPGGGMQPRSDALERSDRIAKSEMGPPHGHRPFPGSVLAVVIASSSQPFDSGKVRIGLRSKATGKSLTAATIAFSAKS